MSPAGSGATRFAPPGRFLPGVLGAGLLSACLWGVSVTAHPATHRIISQPVAGPLTPAWAEFQQECTAKRSPGPGSTPRACVCWEQNLAGEQIEPTQALDVLKAAEVGGDASYVVPENLAGSVAMADAMQGCGPTG
jgi:hypothetical protein